MKRASHACDHESEVLDLCLTDSWPARADDDLRQHVDQCSSCRELVVVVSALAGPVVTPEVRPLPDAALVWHRAQMRARREGAARAERPLVLIEITAGAVACLILVLWASSLGDVAARMGQDIIASVQGTLGAWLSASAVDAPAAASSETSPLLQTLLIVVGASLVVLAAAAGLSHVVDRADRA